VPSAINHAEQIADAALEFRLRARAGICRTVDVSGARPTLVNGMNDSGHPARMTTMTAGTVGGSSPSLAIAASPSAVRVGSVIAVSTLNSWRLSVSRCAR
jgi:hypothetical protein